MESLKHVEHLEGRISKLQGDIQAANAELPALAAQLCEARAVYSAEVAKAQEVHFGRLKAELTEQCAASGASEESRKSWRRSAWSGALDNPQKRCGSIWTPSLQSTGHMGKGRAPMSHGYNGSKRFANYVSHAPLPAVKRDVARPNQRSQNQ
jgi:hypothetical protein